jgi:hypothetical protein
MLSTRSPGSVIRSAADDTSLRSNSTYIQGRKPYRTCCSDRLRGQVRGGHLQLDVRGRDHGGLLGLVVMYPAAQLDLSAGGRALDASHPAHGRVPRRSHQEPPACKSRVSRRSELGNAVVDASGTHHLRRAGRVGDYRG